MCYSGKCLYENYIGECSIRKDVSDKWEEKGYSPCISEWESDGTVIEYYKMKQEIENELKEKI